MEVKAVLLMFVLIAFKPYFKAPLEICGTEIKDISLTTPERDGVFEAEDFDVEVEDSEVDGEDEVSDVDGEDEDSEVDVECVDSEVDVEAEDSEVDGEDEVSDVDGEDEDSEVDVECVDSEVDGVAEDSEVDRAAEDSEVNVECVDSEVDGVAEDSEVDVEGAVQEYNNMSFTETLVFWEYLACGESSFCSSTRGKPNLTQTGLFSCDACLCDDCDIYGDCCLGNSYLRNVSSVRLESLECLSGTEGWYSFTAQSYYLIGSCPEKYMNLKTIEACEDRSRRVLEAVNSPPVYSRVSRLSYINSHCAKCHEDLEMAETWTPNFICADSRDLQTITSREDLLQLVEEGSACYLSFSPPPNSVARKCQRVEPIGECNITGKWQDYDPVLQEACGMYSHVVDANGARYRNVFCILCNEEAKTLEGLGGTSDISAETEGDSTRNANVMTKSVVPFSRIFDLTPDKASRPTSGKTECPGNFVFDTFKEECRGLVCSDGRIPYNHSCVGVLPTARGVTYKLYFDLAPTKRNSTRDEIWGAFRGEIKRLSSSLQPCYQRLDMYKYSITKVSWEGDPAHVPTWLEYNVHLGSFITQEEAEFYLLDTLKSSWFVHGAPGMSHFYSVHIGNNSEQFMRNTLYESETNATKLCDESLNETSVITLTKLSRCNQIELEGSEFSVNASAGTLTLKAWGSEIDVFEYLAVENKIRICVNFSGWFQSKNKRGVDETEYWLTLISLTVSVSALFLTFLLSLYSRSRKTVPALITIMLVVTLFLAQGLFLLLPLASGNKWACQIIGLITHYSWLVVFAWKNVAAFHMYVAFTQPFTNRSTSPRRVLLKYALFAFGTPAILVTFYVLAQSMLSNQERFGYTNDCFLSAPVDLGVAFVAPVALVLLINGYFFTRVVHALKKMSEFEKNSNQSNSAHTALFIKMSLILGFMWAAGFLSNMLEVKVLWYLFDVLNGGVGVLIFLIQVFNNQFQYRAKKALWSRGKSTARTTTTEPSGRI